MGRAADMQIKNLASRFVLEVWALVVVGTKPRSYSQDSIGGFFLLGGVMLFFDRAMYVYDSALRYCLS